MMSESLSYADHPVYQAMMALLKGHSNVVLELDDSADGMFNRLAVGLFLGNTKNSFAVWATDAAGGSGEIVFSDDDARAAYQLAAALTAWADWRGTDEPTPPAPASGLPGE
jgi:hypothetical protein